MSLHYTPVGLQTEVKIPMKERVKYLVGGVWAMTLPFPMRSPRPDTSSPVWPLIPRTPWTIHLLHRLPFPCWGPLPLLAPL